jgi:ketosteroid isomerase-like protein
VSVADRLRTAFEIDDFEEMISVLDPDVVWRGFEADGEEVAMCRNRDEVRSVFEWHRSQGHHASPRIVAEDADTLVVEMRLDAPPPGLELHQVLTVSDDRVVRIQDFPDRRSAFAHAGLA